MCDWIYIVIIVGLILFCIDRCCRYSDRIRLLESKQMFASSAEQRLHTDLTLAECRLEHAWKENEELTVLQSHVPADCCITDACRCCAFGEPYIIHTGLHRRETTYYCKKRLCNGFVERKCDND